MSGHVAAGVVSWSDTDASGRFHFTAPWRWVENAEHALYRSLVPGVEVGRFPRRAVSATYERPLLAGDEYTIELDVEKVGRTSIAYAWRIVGPDGVCVTGGHTVVHVDVTGRPAEVPQDLRAGLAVLASGGA